MPTFSTGSIASSDTKIMFTTDPDDMIEDVVKTELDHNLVFIFIVDRSGSMSGMSIEITKEALVLFF
jgi:Mg-chelatase subunit ChlD